MNPAEREKIEGRAAALREALAPFRDVEMINATISAMLAGFRAMRHEDVSAVVDITRSVLRDMPAWAIQRGCLEIARNRAGLDRRYAPNDAEIHDVVAAQVRMYRDNLATAEALLAAPVEEPEPAAMVPPSAAEIETKLGRPIGKAESAPHTRPVLPGGDGKHAQRIAADLAARKARNAERNDDGALVSDL